MEFIEGPSLQIDSYAWLPLFWMEFGSKARQTKNEDIHSRHIYQNRAAQTNKNVKVAIEIQ